MPAGPYGLGFGLGEAGAAVGQGVLNAKIMAPQLAGLNIQNQQRQMDLTNQQAQNAALSQSAPDVEDTGNPYSQMAANSLVQYKAFMDKGLGSMAHQMQPQLIDLKKKEMAYTAGQGVRDLFTGEYDSAAKLLTKAGMPTSKIEKNDDGTWNMYHPDAPDTPVKVGPEALQKFIDPEQIQGIINQNAQNQFFMQRMLGQQAGQRTLQQQKDEAAATRLQMKNDFMGDQNDQNRALKQSLGYLHESGLNSRQQSNFSFRLQNEPLINTAYKNLVAGGEDPMAAYAAVNQIQANAKQTLPKFMSDAQRSSENNGIKWTPAHAAAATQQWQQAQAQGAPKLKVTPKPLVPTPGATTPPPAKNAAADEV